MTAAAGLASTQWIVGAGFLDYDNDGWLDLLAVGYTTWSSEMDRFCGDSARGIRVYCHPRFFEAVPLVLYRNRGDGRFEDTSPPSGIARHRGRGMGVAFADYDRDGRLDAYVTNDKLPSFLFQEPRRRDVRGRRLASGTLLPEAGQEISAMGVDFRDYDNDGWPDVHVTALRARASRSTATWAMASSRTRLSVRGSPQRSRSAAAGPTRSWTSTTTAGRTCSRPTRTSTTRSTASSSRSYRETNSVFRNRGDGSFEDVLFASGLASAAPRAPRRGFGDLDGDGRIDVVVSALGEPAELWHNESPAGHWLALRLVGTKSNRDGIGAVVKLSASGDPRWREQWNHATTSYGYASASAGPLHFGTGSATTIDRVEIRWPSGTLQVLEKVAVDQLLTVRETP